MRRLLAALAVAGIALIPAAAAADPGPKSQADTECSHGNSNKPCKDDPQPDHGKECQVHGNHGGVNEDHCKEETSPSTSPPTTIVTTPQPTTMTTDTAPSPDVPTTTPDPGSPSSSTPTSPETGSSSSTPGTSCVTPDGDPYVTSYPTCPQPLAELPRTGGGLTLAVGGLSFLAAGLVIRWVTR